MSSIGARIVVLYENRFGVNRLPDPCVMFVRRHREQADQPPHHALIPR
jgi:hypothetical protein